MEPRCSSSRFGSSHGGLGALALVWEAEMKRSVAGVLVEWGNKRKGSIRD